MLVSPSDVVFNNTKVNETMGVVVLLSTQVQSRDTGVQISFKQLGAFILYVNVARHCYMTLFLFVTFR